MDKKRWIKAEHGPDDEPTEVECLQDEIAEYLGYGYEENMKEPVPARAKQLLEHAYRLLSPSRG